MCGERVPGVGAKRSFSRRQCLASRHALQWPVQYTRGRSPAKVVYQRKTPSSLKRVLDGVVLELEIAIPQYRCVCTDRAKVQSPPDLIGGSMNESPPEAASMRLRFDTLASETTEHFDRRFTRHSGQFAYRLHFSVALFALAGIPDLLAHPAMVCAKPVGRMKFCPVRLRLKWQR
jgi:hypothetical protein